MITTVCPIFEKDGNEFIVCLEDFTAVDHWDAMKIGWGVSLVEAILWRAKFTGRVVDVTLGVPHYTANLAGTPVAIIAGPLFDDALVGKESLACPNGG